MVLNQTGTQERTLEENTLACDPMEHYIYTENTRYAREGEVA